ncbi:MAG: hypothetical protein NVSMB19_07590 [Vulcanimicrobiaceae bacterium]
MQQCVVPGIAMWSVWQPDRRLYFNSFFVESQDGNVAIDPLPLDDADASEIAARGGLAWIAITNRDHERDARALGRRFGAKLAASVRDAASLAGPLDRALQDGDAFCGATVLALDGFKTPGEFALHYPARSAVVLGDALWGSPAGALRLMPDDKLADPLAAALSLRRIAALRPEHVLVGDGACIFGDATRALWSALDARGVPGMRRINRDEAIWRTWDTGPERYASASIEIGDLIGAERLGYRLTRIEPGTATCPLHWHTAEEELFVVLAGRATLLTPAGRTPLRTGDYVAFPTQPHGAHKIVNDSTEPCEILMIANVDRGDVCAYPDSHKVLVEATGLLVRDRPVLDYWDGE